MAWIRVAILLFVSPMCLVGVAAAQNWPQWRGPYGTGVSSERQMPVHWSTQQGIVWKRELPAWGTSTPAIWGNAIFVTTHTEDQRLQLLAIHRRTGNVVWTRDVGTGLATREAPKRSKQKFHKLHNLASPSPVTDGKTVVAHFGNGDLAAYDYEGNQLWKHNLQQEHGDYSIWWGHANSPVIHDDLVISVCMQDSLTDVREKPVESYVIAHDLKTGRRRWMTPRMTSAQAEECDAYTTPLMIEADGRQQLVIMGGNQLDGYDPRQGRQLWHLTGLKGGRTVTGPTFAHGMIFTTRGMRGELLAVKPEGDGLLNQDVIQWTYDRGTPDTPCPVVWKDWLYTVTDDGIARCLNAKTGKLIWKQRIRGKYKASPIAVHGRVLFLNTEGLCTVISATARFDSVAENQLDDETIASPAIVDGQIFIRGRKYLWCIGRP